MATRTFEYGPYELVCTADSAPEGGFKAALLIVLGHDGAREETPVALDKAPLFKNEDDAIAHAQASGIEWVDNFG